MKPGVNGDTRNKKGQIPGNSGEVGRGHSLTTWWNISREGKGLSGLIERRKQDFLLDENHKQSGWKWVNYPEYWIWGIAFHSKSRIETLNKEKEESRAKCPILGRTEVRERASRADRSWEDRERMRVITKLRKERNVSQGD